MDWIYYSSWWNCFNNCLAFDYPIVYKKTPTIDMEELGIVKS